MKTVAIIVGAVMMVLTVIAPSFAHTTTWKEIYTRACELYQTGKPADALEQAQLAVQEAEKRFGSNSINTAKSLDLFAEITRAQGNLAEAAQLYNRSLAIQEKVVGPAHPRVVKTMCALAELNAQQNCRFEARALYEKARAAAEAANHGEGLDSVAPMLGLAKLHHTAGNYVACGQLCKRILDISQRYAKYQPNLAASVSGKLSQLAEVSSLHESQAYPGRRSPNAL